MKVKFGVPAFWQTAVVPLIFADVGFGFTFMFAVPDWGCEQPFASATLIKLYTEFPVIAVDAGTVTELPALVVTVRFEPPFRV